MQLKDIHPQILGILNDACDGAFQIIQAYAKIHNYDARVIILTKFEGLPDGQMKLKVELTNDHEVVNFGIAELKGSAIRIGWDLYLQDLLGRARTHLGRAEAKLDKVNEATKYSWN